MNKNTWHELIIRCDDASKEPVTAVLFAHGCVGVSEEGGVLSAYFGRDADPEEIKRALGLLGDVAGEVSVEQREVYEQDWYAPFKEGFGPFRAAGLLITPPWKEPKPGPGEDVLILDPGQAFGTGEHETTVTVLEMLRELAGSSDEPAKMRLLDLGTGTGILAVAAYIFGFRDITAVDTEPRAFDTAAANIAHNGLDGVIKLMPGSIKDAGKGYDIIAANLFLEAHVHIARDVAAALRPGGSVIASGLLECQEGPFMDAAESAGLGLADRRVKGNWLTVRLQCSPASSSKS